MTQLELIQQNLACHIHSEATYRIAKPPFVEGISRKQIQWLIDELTAAQKALSKANGDLADANELLRPSKSVDLVKEIQDLKAIIAKKDEAIGGMKRQVEDRDALITALQGDVQNYRAGTPPLMRWIWEKIHSHS